MLMYPHIIWIHISNRCDVQVERFLNKPEVKKSFGVDPAFDYKRYNPKVHPPWLADLFEWSSAFR